MMQEVPHDAGVSTSTDDANSSAEGSIPTTTDQAASTSPSSAASSGPTVGTTGTGIAAEETGFAESGSLPDTAAPPVAR